MSNSLVPGPRSEACCTSRLTEGHVCRLVLHPNHRLGLPPYDLAAVSRQMLQKGFGVKAVFSVNCTVCSGGGAAQKDLRCEAREKSTSGGVLRQQVGARRPIATRHPP